ncbi:Rrf2 family transcriptional regulator [bacterium]|nr:MAG: Rrf2 family transcriptional regulator [bacterium]
MFSKSCIYGIQAMSYIAQKSGERDYTGLKEISEDRHIPLHYLSKVLQILVKHKILKSAKGNKGGFSLARDPEKINLLEIIDAIDGLDNFNSCVIGLKECSSESACPVHEQYKTFQEELRKNFTEKNFRSLVEDIKKGKSFDPLPWR